MTPYGLTAAGTRAIRRTGVRHRRDWGGRRGKVAVGWRSDATELRIAKLFVPRGERAPPLWAQCGKTFKDFSASGVDDEALVASRSGANVGKIDTWPPHERRRQDISLRLETPLDVTGIKRPPWGAH